MVAFSLLVPLEVLRADAPFDWQPSGTVVIEKTPVNDGPLTIILDCLGKKLTFLVSTRSADSAFDLEFSRLLEPVDRSADNGLDSGIWCKAPQMKCGKMQLPIGEHIWCQSLVALEKGTGQSLDGVLGMDVLRKLIVAIDADRRQLVLSVPVKADKLPPGTITPIEWSEDRLPMTKLSIGKNQQENCIIDTLGWNTFGLEAKSCLRALENKAIEPLDSYSVVLTSEGKEELARHFRCHVCQVGDLRQRSLIGEVNKRNVIGWGFLSRFNVVFHFPESKIVWVKGNRFSSVDHTSLFGLSIAETVAGPGIVSVAKGSESERAGLKSLDFIKQINGVDVSQYTYGQLCRRLSVQSTGDVKIVVVRDSKVLALELKQ
ncbi:MAG: hypothetical protein ACKVP0_14370 [Pirellulaceae bacterium]